MDTQENMTAGEIARRSSDKDEFDEWLIERATWLPFPQTEYQCKHFVADSHPTRSRAVKQAMLEVQVRKHSLEKVKVAKKKNGLIIAKFERDIENEPDPIQKEILACDRDDAKFDDIVWQQKILQSEMEMRYFLDYIKEHVDTTETEEAKEYVQNIFVRNPEEEHKYWIARMAKQAAVDMLSSGTINQGNMESILQMSEEDQVKCIEASMKYSGVVNAGINALKEEAQTAIKYLGKDDVNKMLADGQRESDNAGRLLDGQNQTI